MAKRTWKQWTVEEKLKILNYCDEHSTVKAAQKFNVSRSVIYKWKTDLRKGGILSLEWGQSTTKLTKDQRRHYRINLENNKYETMSREELIERAKLGDSLKKHETVSIKNKYFLLIVLKWIIQFAFCVRY